MEQKGQHLFQMLEKTHMHQVIYNLQLKRELLQDIQIIQFGPKDPITRGHMAFILQRAFNLTEESNVGF